MISDVRRAMHAIKPCIRWPAGLRRLVYGDSTFENSQWRTFVRAAVADSRASSQADMQAFIPPRRFITYLSENIDFYSINTMIEIMFPGGSMSIASRVLIPAVLSAPIENDFRAATLPWIGRLKTSKGSDQLRGHFQIRLSNGVVRQTVRTSCK